MVAVSFTNPGYLFFLLLVPLFILIHFLTLKSSKTTALKFANFEAIAKIKGIDFISKNILTLILSIIIVSFLVLALAETKVEILANTPVESIVIAIDTSKSMEATDILPNRLEAAKKSTKEFINFLPLGVSVGIVSFSGNSLIESDLTNVKSTLKFAVDDISLSEISGTDIYEAIITSSNLLKNKNSKAVILLSDGQINVGTIENAINYANENSIIVYAIGIGTKKGGETSFGLSKLDQDTLKSLAYNSGGEYFDAIDEKSLKESLINVFQKKKSKVKIDLTIYLLIFSIILFSLEYILISFKYRRLI